MKEFSVIAFAFSTFLYAAYSEHNLLGSSDDEILENADRLWGGKESEVFEKTRHLHHKWSKSSPPPENYKEAGILEDAVLVSHGFHLDGGTIGYLLKDSKGNYFALCTGPGLQSEDHPSRIDAPIGSRMFVGALHYASPEARIVEARSDSDRFLKKLTKRANEAFELSKKILGLDADGPSRSKSAKHHE